MKLSNKWFYVVGFALSAGVTGALESGLVPAAYVPFVAGLSTLLAHVIQKAGK